MPPRADSAEIIMPFLDRLTTLTESEKDSRDEHLPPVRKLKRKLGRDLEWLFNTRANREVPPEYKDAYASVMNYGLPDVSNLSMSNVRDKQRLEKAIELAINTFEPRLTGVQVRLVNDGSEGSKRVRYHIDAMLRLEPMPERISFDTDLDVLSGQYEVKGDGSAG